MGFVTAMGGWIQGIQILQSSMSSPSVSLVLKTGPRCADDQTDLWCNLCKPFAPCELENQRKDFRMALGQRLSSLCYLIANFHRLFSFTCSTFSFVFSVKDQLQRHHPTLSHSVISICMYTLDDTMTFLRNILEEYNNMFTLSRSILYLNLNQKVKHNYNRPLQQATYKS